MRVRLVKSPVRRSSLDFVRGLTRSLAILHVQMDLALKRIDQLRAQLAAGTDPCVPSSPTFKVGMGPHHPFNICSSCLRAELTENI